VKTSNLTKGKEFVLVLVLLHNHLMCVSQHGNPLAPPGPTHHPCTDYTHLLGASLEFWRQKEGRSVLFRYGFRNATGRVQKNAVF
jgi:hypothetical protein